MVSYLPHMSHVAYQYEIKDITYIINHIGLSPIKYIPGCLNSIVAAKTCLLFKCYLLCFSNQGVFLILSKYFFFKESLKI